MSRRLAWLLIIVGPSALALAPVVSAHGGGVGKGYVSTVLALRPVVADLAVEMLDGDDRLRLENASGKTILIRGYAGEPYLRFSPDGVYENRNSPATYVNNDRLGRVDVPATADADAPPRWEKVFKGDKYEWHDHRAHWMSQTPPKPIQDAPDRQHHVFNWEVPASADGRPFTIAGRLDYFPVDDEPSPLVFALGISALLAATLFGLIALKRYRSSRPA